MQLQADQQQSCKYYSGETTSRQIYSGTFAPQNELLVIYTDFVKTFDKVCHNKLISKLGSYSIHEVLVNGLEHFTV